MSELRYPNESRAYRDARDGLLKDEQALVAAVKALAAKRRTLPPGGELKQDYVFQWANDGRVGQPVKFSELFGDKNTLLLYSFMYGPNWDKQRKAANQRDNFTCQFCGKKKTTRYLDAAHVVPFRHFGLQRYKKANRLSNLVTLCRSCHTKYDWANGTRT